MKFAGVRWRALFLASCLFITFARSLMQKKYLLATLLVVLVIISCACWNIQIYGPKRDASVNEEKNILSKIALQYGVSEGWPSARFAIYCLAFRSGRPIRDVESDLTRLGAWRKYGNGLSAEYKLDSISVEDQRFDVLAIIDANLITRILVFERSDQSDSQPIICQDDSYIYASQ